jgi:hypothetical protein
VVVALVISGIIASVTLSTMQQTMLPGQQIQWQGWYVVLYFGAYATGLAALPALVVLWLVRRNAEQRRRRLEFRERMKQFNVEDHAAPR